MKAELKITFMREDKLTPTHIDLFSVYKIAKGTD